MNIHRNFEPFLWPWPWLQQSNPIFSQDNSAYDEVPSNQVQLQNDQQFRKYNRSYFDIWSFTVTLILKTANQSFWKTICLMMLHHHTKFASTRFSSWEDYHLDKHSLTFYNSAVTLTLNTVIQVPHKTLWLIIMYYQTRLVAKGSAVQKI